MGALHLGHLNLIKTATENNDVTVASIFVNPTQFNEKEDLENYPNTIEKDKKALEKAGCDLLFLPEPEEIYPDEETISFNFGYLESVMEGQFRIGHFSGVGLIVSKLFNIVEPNRAYFGEKDLQQLTLIKKLVKDLNFNIEIIGVPTVREPSGLAMSSRNLKLSKSDQELAANIYKALNIAKELIFEDASISMAKTKVNDFFQALSGIEVEYLEFVDTISLIPIAKLSGSQKISICIAAYINGVRLIDNISFTI